jgi:hypothetical protein
MARCCHRFGTTPYLNFQDPEDKGSMASEMLATAPKFQMAQPTRKYVDPKGFL